MQTTWADIEAVAVDTRQIESHAPSKWTASNLDGVLERLARKVAETCGFGDVIDDSCLSVARKIRKEVSALAALKAYARMNQWFRDTAGRSHPGWQAQYIIAEVKRYAAQEEKKRASRAADRAAFAHGTQEHLRWLTDHPRMRDFCECWDERDDKPDQH